MKDAAGKQVHALVDHLFRHQAGQMVASLTRVFGARHLDLAEEVVQEALVKALQLWPFRGVPENPAGWLVQVARNRALDRLRRDATLRDKAPQLLEAFDAQQRATAAGAALPGELLDDELALMFIFPTASLEEARALTEADPAVQTGRLRFELHPWMTARGVLP